jgi:ABC-type phosphate/phosphonate transport system substrate-binding protein
MAMYRLSYYPWLTQNVPPEEIRRQIDIFARGIGDALARHGRPDPKVVVLPAVDVPDQISQLINGDAEIGLMNPLGFAFARRRSGDLEAVAVAQRIIDGKVGTVYFAQLYARRDSGLTDLGKIRGRSIGYGTPYSTSNFLVPAQLIYDRGIHPLLGFKRIEFLGGHEIVARAVYDGKVDVGAGHDGVIVDLAGQRGYEDAREKLLQMARSSPIPSDPVVVRVSDSNERMHLQNAIIEAGNSPEGKDALKIFWGNTQGVERTVSENYRVLLTVVEKLKFDETDLLPKRDQ